MDEYAIPDCNA